MKEWNAPEVTVRFCRRCFCARHLRPTSDRVLSFFLADDVRPCICFSQDHANCTKPHNERKCVVNSYELKPIVIVLCGSRFQALRVVQGRRFISSGRWRTTAFLHRNHGGLGQFSLSCNEQVNGQQRFAVSWNVFRKDHVGAAARLT